MSSSEPSPCAAGMSRMRLFLEWTASFAAISLTALAIYCVDDYLHGRELPELWVALAVTLVIAPSAAGLFGLLLRLQRPFRDHARTYLMMTFMILGGTVAKVYVGKGPHLAGAAVGVLLGAAVWWVLWRPKNALANDK